MKQRLKVFLFTGVAFLLCFSASGQTVDEKLNDLIVKIERLSEEPSSIEKKLALQNEYFVVLDNAINKKMQAYVNDSFSVAKAQAAEINQKKLEQLEQLKNNFLENVIYFKTTQDFKRFNAFYEYQVSFKNIMARASSVRSKSGMVGLKRLLGNIKNGFRLLEPFTKMGYYTVFPELSDEKGTPLTMIANNYFEKVAINRKIEVEIQGKDHINQNLPKGEINIILGNHVSADNDAIVLSRLGLESYVTFGALNLKGEGIFSLATHSLFTGVLNRIDLQRDLILLGRGTNPLERLAEVLKSGRTQNLFLFPQGMISLGFNETNPIKPNFSEKTIRFLQNQGFKVNLHVLTMPDNFENSLSLERETSVGKTLRAVVSESIKDETLRSVFERIGSEGTDSFIRYLWIKNIRKFHPDYLGVLSDEEIVRNNPSIVKSCNQLFLN